MNNYEYPVLQLSHVFRMQAPLLPLYLRLQYIKCEGCHKDQINLDRGQSRESQCQETCQ